MYELTENVLIDTPVFTSAIILPFTFIPVTIWIIIFKGTAYLFPALLLLIILFYQLWKLFDPINSIRINLKENFFILSSKNPIKFLLKKREKLVFNEIKNFVMIKSSSIIVEETKYVVSAILKDGSTIPFSQSLKEKVAKEITKFLNRIVHSS